ncbi:MAG: hypothetical protein IH614_12140, partial [Desulfuromonadales bacterium]|nr:hypothetical protein [Desulfuromonadales bacterium]
MRKAVVILVLVLCGWGMTVGAQERVGDGFWRHDRGRIYGQELMAPEERQEFQRRYRELRTESERDRFRERHRQSMQARARNLGVAAPEDEFFSDWRTEKFPAEGDGWPADGLRRWPEERISADGLRRWPAEAPAWSTAKGVRNLSADGDAAAPPAPAEEWTTHRSGGWG